MNPVSDNLLSSLSGAVPKAGLAAAAGLSDGQDTTGQPSGDAPAQDGFAAVMGRVQAAGGAEASPAAPGQGAETSSELGQAALAGAPVGGPVGYQGRQEFAAGLSLQWAALLRGDAGVKLAGGDVGAPSPTVDSPDPGANPGVVSALSDNVEWQVSRKVAQTSEAAVVGRLGLDNAGDRAVLDVALQALPPALKADGEGAMVKGDTPDAPHDVPPVDDKAGAPLMPVPALVTWHLSPQLAVITASQPAASDESLRAFAAEQGFDAQALSRMFGVDAAEVAAPAVSAGLKARETGSTVAAASWVAGLPGATGGWNGEKGPSGPGGLASADSLVQLGAGQAVPQQAATRPEVGTLASGVQKALGDSIGSQNKSMPDKFGSFVPKSGVSLAEALAAFREDGGRLESMRSTVGSMGRTGDGAALAGGLAPAGGVVTTASAGLAAWWALQARGEAGPARAGAGAALPGAALSDPMPEVLSGPGSVGSSAAAVVASPIVESPTPIQKAEAHERPIDSQPLDLREHLEQGHEALSKRMGEALAARLLAQIDKGEWQIRLSVNPQHLGPIDIDLQMQGQRMEAQFQVAHGQTQALIQDSLPRLREAVGASGMDLASVWVSGGWSDRNRGNPTPGQPENPAALALNDGAGDEQTVGATAQVDPNRPEWTGRPGALDVLI